MPPPVPHVVVVGALHVLPEQHPVLQDAALHTQTPDMHACPGAHCERPPHVHAPAVHPSAVMSHGVHAPPPMPHAEAVGIVVHVVPEQHPVQVMAQLAHVPALQTRPPQSWQLPPPVPHTPCALPGSHVLPLQQPAHDVLSQTHDPPWQCCPIAHAAPPPHVQAPAAEQPSPVVVQSWHAPPAVPQAPPVVIRVHTLPVQQPLAHEVIVHWHEPLAQTCPAAHAAPAPQRQPPEGEQLSASVALQVVHRLPSVPQLDSDGETHAPLLQHPLGQDAELQTQWPLTHS